MPKDNMLIFIDYDEIAVKWEQRVPVFIHHKEISFFIMITGNPFFWIVHEKLTHMSAIHWPLEGHVCEVGLELTRSASF